MSTIEQRVEKLEEATRMLLDILMQQAGVNADMIDLVRESRN